MAEKYIRIGKISKIDYESGMAEVTYPDMDNAVTAPFPLLSFNDEYKMPQIGEEVAVLHLSNGTANGIILGPYWNLAKLPAISGENVFRKEFSKTPGQAYIQFKDGTVEYRGPAIRYVCASGTFTAAQVLKLFDRVGALEKANKELTSRLSEVEKKV